MQSHLELSSAMYTGIFTKEDTASLPEPVQNHFRMAGLIGKPIPNSVRAFMSSVPLYETNDKPPLNIDYTLYLFASPVRLAHIQTSMFGIPFEGYDSSQEGIGFMKGVIGKVFTLFNVAGPNMDSGQILTWLGEAPLLPSIFLSEYIIWETIDATSVRATLNYKGVTGSGVYTFDENGFFQSFHTKGRAKIDTNGSVEYIGWSAMYDEWQQDENGTCAPYSVRAVWHESGGDLVYFASSGFDVVYD
ncbi:MAG: hypothetical protein FWE11_09040 [Defluviitaleaceae bacterium]|nr:hypothetical protein [Defluviitaleaceae bacterium]